jgi:hypothetical protein
MMLILNYSYCEQNVTSFLLSCSLILYLRLISQDSSESALSSDMEVHSDRGFAEIDVNSHISTVSCCIVLGSWYSVCVRRKLRISNSILPRKLEQRTHAKFRYNLLLRWRWFEMTPYCTSSKVRSPRATSSFIRVICSLLRSRCWQ